MRGATTTCDNCGTPLYGKQGTHWIGEEHLSFKGVFTVQMPEHSDYCYVSKDPYSEHHFCNIKCLGEFIQFQMNKYLSIRKRERVERLRGERDLI